MLGWDGRKPKVLGLSPKLFFQDRDSWLFKNWYATSTERKMQDAHYVIDNLDQHSYF